MIKYPIRRNQLNRNITALARYRFFDIYQIQEIINIIESDIPKNIKRKISIRCTSKTMHYQQDRTIVEQRILLKN
jgi:hypothetical protein